MVSKSTFSVLSESPVFEVLSVEVPKQLENKNRIRKEIDIFMLQR
jgi:hypothetical protein